MSNRNFSSLHALYTCIAGENSGQMIGINHYHRADSPEIVQ